MKNFVFLFILTALAVSNVSATEGKPACMAGDFNCIAIEIEALASDINDERWRDQTYRELAKAMAAEGEALKALPIITKITSPDTKALTIRGVGMEAAMAEKVPEGLFIKLRTEAEKISHPPSYGIALTYIAMAQAYADDDAGAAKTASEMENEALRYKAYGETAEIQAEKGKFNEAIKSITVIEDIAFRNKAFKNVSHIFAERRKYQNAYDTAKNITNPVMQAEALQFILDEQRRAKEEQKEQE